MSCSRWLVCVGLGVMVSVAQAQRGEALIRKVGASNVIAAPTFPANPALEYKVAWDVTEGPATPDSATAGFARPANFLVMTDDSKVPRSRVKLAIIVHGTATRSLLQNAAYRAATGVDNPNLALLQALHDAGVRIIVCGQALVNRKVPRSATLARATLHAEGYATF
jgi:intracellular sulfur oxidation DsrE/DsrF family protein